MANTCYNYLTLSEAHSDRILLHVLNEDGVVDYNLLVPIPDDVTALTNPLTEEPYKGERDWGWNNVGAPGIAHDTEIEELDDGSTYVSFESEWTPPNLWFNALCNTCAPLDDNDKSPMNIELEYAEYDTEVAGKLNYVKEPTDGNHSISVKYAGEDLRDALGLPELTKSL